MSACSAVLLNKPQGLEKDQPWCAPLTPGCPVGLRSLPTQPTPIFCHASFPSLPPVSHLFSPFIKRLHLHVQK